VRMVRIVASGRAADPRLSLFQLLVSEVQRFLISMPVCWQDCGTSLCMCQ
jgi:hypothetical protein